MSEPFVALPPRAAWRPLLAMCAGFAAWFVVCYGGGAWVSAIIPWRVHVSVPLDSQIPFLPAAAALYLTIGPALLLAPFVFREPQALRPLFVAVMLETTLAGSCFLLLPVDDAPVTCEAATAACEIFRLADVLNLHHNNFPSLHVAFACTLALAYAPRTRFGVLWIAWALAVSASTLLTHQHFLLDVVAGLVLGVVGWRVARRQSSARSGLAAREPSSVGASSSGQRTR